MAFSIEPGIYLAGRHGARIEDIVVATDDGVERLNVTDRDLVVLDGLSRAVTPCSVTCPPRRPPSCST